MDSRYIELARLCNSRVKGHHAFKSNSSTGDNFVCERELANSYSAVTIVVKRGRQASDRTCSREDYSSLDLLDDSYSYYDLDLDDDLKERKEAELTILQIKDGELQQMLCDTKSYDHKSSLQKELALVKKKITAVTLAIRRYEKHIKLVSLSNKEFHDQYDVFQKRKKQREFESKQLFDEAMKEGSVLLDIINVLLSGVAGSGKTSLLDILMGKLPKPESERTSTPCMKKPVRIRPVTNARFEAVGDEWKEINRRKLIRLVANTMVVSRSKVGGLLENHPKSAHEESVADSDEEDSTSVYFEMSHVEKAISTVTELVMQELSKQSKRSTKSSDSEMDEIRSLIHSVLMYVADCGGQPQFQDVCSLFTRHTSVALLVSRVIDDFSSFPLDEYFKDGKQVGTPLASHMTHGETLVSLLRSLRSHNKHDKNPLCLFIGTFLDQLNDLGVLDRRNETLREMLTPEIMNDVVYSNAGLKNLIFALNTLSRDELTLATARAIRKAVESAPPRKVKVPIRWFLFELALQELCSITDTWVLTKGQCCDIARSVGILSAAVDAALDFFDEVCIAHYYPSVLPDVIFVDPQVPLDKVSELTEYAISLRDVKDAKGSLPSCTTAMLPKWKKFRDEGIITLDILKSEHFQKHYEGNPFTPADLLKIMKELLVVAPLEISSKSALSDDEAEYFMPTLLSSVHPSKLEELRAFKSPVAPLLIRFPSGCIRCGVFCCLVVYMQKNHGWKVSLPSAPDPELLAKNCVKFKVPKLSGSVTIIDSFTQVEVHIKSSANTCVKLCPMVKKSLLEGIDKACQVLHYNNDHPDICFFCPGPHMEEHTSKQHFAEFNEEDGTWSCTVESDVYGDLEQNQKFWFGCQPTPNPLSNPGQQAFIRELPGITSDTPVKPQSGAATSIAPLFTSPNLNNSSVPTTAQGELKFSPSMTCTDVCLLLRQKGVPERDIIVFKEQGVDGSVFMDLPSDANALNKEFGHILTVGGRKKLSQLLGEVKLVLTHADHQPDVPKPPFGSTIDELRKCLDLTDEQLKERIQKSDLFHLAEVFGPWKNYTGDPGLGLNSGEVHTIHSDLDLTTNQSKVRAALDKWRAHNPLHATFWNLLEVVMTLNEKDVAMDICKYIKKQSAVSNDQEQIG